MKLAKPGSDSARRALDLYFAFENFSTATVKELSVHTGIPLPTAHRYVAMLRDMGLVEDVRQGSYRLTMRVVALANVARRATSVLDVIQPHVQALNDELGETVLLVQPIAGLPVCMHRVETQRRLRLSFEVGQRMPALRGASAHLLLGVVEESDREQHVQDLLDRGEVPPQNSVHSFLADANRDIARGWATSSAEIDEGVWSAAASIRSDGRTIGTLSVPCIEFTIDEPRSQQIITAVVEAAERINVALGG